MIRFLRRHWLVVAVLWVHLYVGYHYWGVVYDHVRLQLRVGGHYEPAVELFRRGVLQETLEASAQDRFPHRDELLAQYRRLAAGCSAIALDVLPRSWSPWLPQGGGVVRPRGCDYLMRRPRLKTSHDRNLIALKLEEYESIAKRYPDLRVFVVNDVEKRGWNVATQGLPDGTRGCLDGTDNAEAFEKLVPGGFRFMIAGGDGGAEDALSRYFRSDHHWTLYGSWKVYKDLLVLLAPFQPRPAPPIGFPKTERVRGIRYFGSHAREAYALDFFDPIVDGEFRYPNWHVGVASSDENPRTDFKTAYREGRYSRDPMFNHLDLYFGGNWGLIHYLNPSSPNPQRLLVIRDSMVNNIEPMLATHYRQSFFVDPRMYTRHTDKSVGIDDLIERYRPDHLIFFGRQHWILGLGNSTGD